MFLSSSPTFLSLYLSAYPLLLIWPLPCGQAHDRWGLMISSCPFLHFVCPDVRSSGGPSDNRTTPNCTNLISVFFFFYLTNEPYLHWALLGGGHQQKEKLNKYGTLKLNVGPDIACHFVSCPITDPVHGEFSLWISKTILGGVMSGACDQLFMAQRSLWLRPYEGHIQFRRPCHMLSFKETTKRLEQAKNLKDIRLEPFYKNIVTRECM